MTELRETRMGLQSSYIVCLKMVMCGSLVEQQWQWGYINHGDKRLQMQNTYAPSSNIYIYIYLHLTKNYTVAKRP